MKQSYLFERVAFVIALFLFAVGVGLMMDGKKLYASQWKLSQRVDYRATLNPF